MLLRVVTVELVVLVLLRHVQSLKVLGIGIYKVLCVVLIIIVIIQIQEWRSYRFKVLQS